MRESKIQRRPLQLESRKLESKKRKRKEKKEIVSFVVSVAAPLFRYSYNGVAVMYLGLYSVVAVAVAAAVMVVMKGFFVTLFKLVQKRRGLLGENMEKCRLS